MCTYFPPVLGTTRTYLENKLKYVYFGHICILSARILLFEYLMGIEATAFEQFHFALLCFALRDKVTKEHNSIHVQSIKWYHFQ